MPQTCYSIRVYTAAMTSETEILFADKNNISCLALELSAFDSVNYKPKSLDIWFVASASGPLSNEPVHEITNNVVCATSKASDQPAHTRRLIRAFASRLSIL